MLLNKLALSNLSKGNFSVAGALFHVMTIIVPCSTSFNNYGCYLFQDAAPPRINRAIKLLEKANKLSENEKTYANLGACYFGKKEYSKAAECFKIADRISKSAFCVYNYCLCKYLSHSKRIEPEYVERLLKVIEDNSLDCEFRGNAVVLAGYIMQDINILLNRIDDICVLGIDDDTLFKALYVSQQYEEMKKFIIPSYLYRCKVDETTVAMVLELLWKGVWTGDDYISIMKALHYCVGAKLIDKYRKKSRRDRKISNYRYIAPIQPLCGYIGCERHHWL